VYEGAPTSVTAFFAITPKIAILALFLRLCYYTFWDLIASWQEIIIVCALLSMFIGTLGAINQNKIKRLFAYSSIAHVGYLLIALATGSIEAVESLLIYIVIYILMIINVFGILLVLTAPKTGFARGSEGTRFVFVDEQPVGTEEHGALLKQANPL
jgi:NADH-quinone oxidoreductase subunit N